ncbi:MAG: L-threonylcarbamoyladenylate synthase [Armatimonadetes bacterium]|nr:L-threonylcarbamoyladenylate synthase [Armatimonadota bacterium]
MTRVLEVDPVAPLGAALSEAAEVLRRGGLVAFPTETVYGLGANALSPEAVRAVFEAKGRPAANPIIVHIADRSDVAHLTSRWPDAAERIAQAFWPGPVTLVAPRSALAPDVVTAGGETVALRMPAHPVAAALIGAAGVPIAAPSANRSAGISPTTAAHVLSHLAGRIDLVLDGGACAAGIESTVIDTTTDPPTILRPGPVSAEDLWSEAGVRAVAGSTAPGEPHRSPGAMARHYAPNALTVVTEASEDRVHDETLQGRSVAWLRFAREAEPGPGVLSLTMPDDANAYAAVLYARLHQAEAAGVEVIVISQPPSGSHWTAVLDRLSRASRA